MKPTSVPHQILELERERRVLMRSLLRPGPMFAGGLVERWVVCGKAGCRCQTGERHGPYYYRSRLTADGPRLEYLGKDDQSDVTRLKRYQGYQRQMARLNTIQRELVKRLWQLAAPHLRQSARTGGAR
jgi:hypothetical protein